MKQIIFSTLFCLLFVEAFAQTDSTCNAIKADSANLTQLPPNTNRVVSFNTQFMRTAYPEMYLLNPRLLIGPRSSTYQREPPRKSFWNTTGMVVASFVVDQIKYRFLDLNYVNKPGF